MSQKARKFLSLFVSLTLVLITPGPSVYEALGKMLPLPGRSFLKTGGVRPGLAGPPIFSMESLLPRRSHIGVSEPALSFPDKPQSALDSLTQLGKPSLSGNYSSASFRETSTIVFDNARLHRPASVSGVSSRMGKKSLSHPSSKKLRAASSNFLAPPSTGFLQGAKVKTMAPILSAGIFFFVGLAPAFAAELGKGVDAGAGGLFVPIAYAVLVVGLLMKIYRERKVAKMKKGSPQPKEDPAWGKANKGTSSEYTVDDIQASPFVLKKPANFNFEAKSAAEYTALLSAKEKEAFEKEFLKDLLDAVRDYYNSQEWVHASKKGEVISRKDFIRPGEKWTGLRSVLIRNGFFASKTFFIDRIVRRYILSRVWEGPPEKAGNIHPIPWDHAAIPKSGEIFFRQEEGKGLMEELAMKTLKKALGSPGQSNRAIVHNDYNRRLIVEGISPGRMARWKMMLPEKIVDLFASKFLSRIMRIVLTISLPIAGMLFFQFLGVEATPAIPLPFVDLGIPSFNLKLLTEKSLNFGLFKVSQTIAVLVAAYLFVFRMYFKEYLESVENKLKGKTRELYTTHLTHYALGINKDESQTRDLKGPTHPQLT